MQNRKHMFFQEDAGIEEICIHEAAFCDVGVVVRKSVVQCFAGSLQAEQRQILLSPPVSGKRAAGCREDIADFLDPAPARFETEVNIVPLP